MENFEVIKLKVHNHIETRKSLWTATIVLIGGLATIFLSIDSISKLVLFCAGLVIYFIFFQSIVHNNNQIIQLLEDLSKKDK